MLHGVLMDMMEYNAESMTPTEEVRYLGNVMSNIIIPRDKSVLDNIIDRLCIIRSKL